MIHSACVIGSGPNGLAAAILLARAGISVEVLESAAVPGGAVRTMELTLPGFLHDFGATVYPLGIGSPFFSSLPLAKYGLQWLHSAAPVAHALDDGTAVILEHDLEQARTSLGSDGDVWARMMQPFVSSWRDFAEEILRPVFRIPKHPWLIARFGAHALLSATHIVRRFRSERTRALFAGLASHSFLSLTEPLSGAFGLVMGVSAHAVGWPLPRGGSQSLTNALIGHFSALGGKLRTSTAVESISANDKYDLFLCDITPRQLLAIAGDRLSASYKRRLASYCYGPAAFKVDYALSDPVPWRAAECSRAATVHLGGTIDDIAASEKAVREGRHSDRPFVIFVQLTLFDSSRAPAGRHTAWAYCHVPNGSTMDMLPRLESQVERFAPGFRECILARKVLAPSNLESMDANLVGGDVQGGAFEVRQFVFRPTWRGYATSDKSIYVCSASTPPGGGVHGMCGFHAARLALSRLRFA
jgi:phytoene dehydrogenase-like protein